ncbi:MAG TPA: FG-GAP repeat protein, partial [Candidatus Dormibacteraeota bacterium]|nr:FG-GAP repeat protein [Candidatus Dormibacteraeota bacterium]
MRLLTAVAAALLLSGVSATVAAAAAWSQQQELSASDGANSDLFGWSVSVSSDGNTALVGAYSKNSSTGAAYVFSRSGSSWIQQQELTASDGAS